MKIAFCLVHDYDYEGESSYAIFSSKEEAIKIRDQFYKERKNHSRLAIFELPLDSSMQEIYDFEKEEI